MNAMRFLSRLLVVAAILLLGALAVPSGVSAHAGHGGAKLALAGDDGDLGGHHEAIHDDATAVAALDEPGARVGKGCTGACCSVTCSAPSPLPDAAAVRLDIGHAEAPPDAPERHQPKPPRA